MTSNLYKSTGSVIEKRTFDEEISAFLITKDGKQFIVVGKKYHYIFPTTETLKFILTWSEKKRVKATFNEFTTSSYQSVSGKYTLTVDTGNNLAPEINDLLASKGFTRQNSDNSLSYSGIITGTRYLADKFDLPAPLQFNQKYTIAMSEEYSSISPTVTTERILLTPLTIAADGVILIFGMPVALVFHDYFLGF